MRGDKGYNSVFSKKFWTTLKFTDEDEVDIEIKNFNLEYERYSNLIGNNPEIKQERHIGDYKDIDFENKEVSKLRQTKIYF